jgi:hypothetical protein
MMQPKCKYYKAVQVSWWFLLLPAFLVVVVVILVVIVVVVIIMVLLLLLCLAASCRIFCSLWGAGRHGVLEAAR